MLVDRGKGGLRGVGGQERDRERQRETERDRDRETERQTDRDTETDRQTDRQRHRDTETDRQTDRQTEKIYSFRPLPLMKACRWMTSHLTVHPIIIHMNKTANKLTTKCLN